jgi:hypothetical protein
MIAWLAIETSIADVITIGTRNFNIISMIPSNLRAVKLHDD